MITLSDKRPWDVYIKRGPEVGEFTEEQNKKLESLKNEQNKTPAMMITIKILEDFKKHAGEVNYSGCNDFWLERDNGVTYDLLQQRIGTGTVKDRTVKSISYKSFDEMYKDFIDLREFLDGAEYVGRKFEYPEDPKVVSMNGVLNMEAERTLLYRTNDIWIVFSKSRQSGFEYFEILHRSNKENFDYVFYGEPTEEFRDKTELDNAIYKQLTSSPAKRV